MPHRPVFAFSTGHFDIRWPESDFRPFGTDDHFLTYTIAGCGQVRHAGGELLARPGSVLVLLPHTPNDYQVLVDDDPHWERIWVHFHARSEWLDLLGLPEISPGTLYLPLRDPELSGRVEARLRDMHRLATLGVARSEQLAMNALEEALLWCDLDNPVGSTSRLDARVRRAVEHISSDLTAPLVLDRFARKCGLSRSRLCELFRAQVGMTPHQFQEQQRIAAARRLLSVTSRSVGEIAFEVGFASPFYFSLRFKRATGMSPKAFRKRPTSGV